MHKLSKTDRQIKAHNKRVQELKMRGTLTAEMTATLDRQLAQMESTHGALYEECVSKGWLKPK